MEDPQSSIRDESKEENMQAEQESAKSSGNHPATMSVRKKHSFKRTNTQSSAATTRSTRSNGSGASGNKAHQQEERLIWSTAEQL